MASQVSATSSAALAQQDNNGNKRGIAYKALKCPKFAGDGKLGAVGGNVKRWWREFSDQVEVIQAISEQTWTEGQKVATLLLHLEGPALDWYLVHKDTLTLSSFDEVGDM
jgi:hypothetical protein